MLLISIAILQLKSYQDATKLFSDVLRATGLAINTIIIFLYGSVDVDNLFKVLASCI